MSTPETTDRLRRTSEGRADVRVAVLFGSEARGTAGPTSDVDVAVDAPGVDLLDLGATPALALDRGVDVVNLDDATIPLLERLVRDGIVVHEGFRGAGALWRSQTLATLETHRPWYARMRAAQLAELAERIARVRAKCPATPDALRADRDALDLVIFNLMLAVQSCADIAHLFADEGWPSASNLASGFNRLRDEGVISASTAAALCRAVGLRNVVVHGYAFIDPAMVHLAATRGAQDLEAFAREVAAWVAQRQDG